ncbi:MAG: type 4a pilus biogenesis protein PilO [Candidatus Theseobacter exili]|nr:type 4a pilus biogenesis protein PilO [Candidatus Theseobacter exili]
MIKLKREQVLLAIVAVLILSMLFKFVYQPQIRKVVALKGVLVKTSQELREAHILIQQKIGKSTERELEERFATENEVNEILSFLTESAQESGIILGSISQRETARKEFYEDIPIDIEFTTEYEKTLNYLSKIAAFPKLLQIDNLEIIRDETVLPRLRVKLMVRTYVLFE